jgi:hypothetical protein
MGGEGAGVHGEHGWDPGRGGGEDVGGQDAAGTDPLAADVPRIEDIHSAWSAYDLAADTGHGIAWARQALARWRQAGLIGPVGTDSITGALLQLHAARYADQDPIGP